MKTLVKKTALFYLLAALLMLSCNEPAKPRPGNSLQVLPLSLASLTDVIVRDIYTPPVASRIYAYAHLAYYEGIRFKTSSATSITEKLKGFGPMPQPEKHKQYDFTLVGAAAFFEVGRNLVFSSDSLTQSEGLVVNKFFGSLPSKTLNNSLDLGKQIAEVILKRSRSDNYTSTRGMPRFSVYKKDGKWRQTSPDYADVVEPYWRSIQPLLMDSASQFKPTLPPEYDLNKQGQYYRELLEVYELNRNLTATQDTIATYWDDNAFVTQHEGHLMYANKKTTPVGHWMGITAIVCNQQAANEIKAARIYALTACAIFDAFIACWDEKFRSNTVRPITVIQDQLDPEWTSFLQTPPFPEYPSGHSVISSAAATVLTSQLGDNISFTDTTEMKYLGLKRSFLSINAAAQEAGISRLYGGIHFRAAIIAGSWQGQEIGALYNTTFPEK